MDTVEALTQVGVVARHSVDRRRAQGNKQRLVGGSVRSGERARLGEVPEAPLDHHGTAAAVLHLEGLGGLHTTYKAPL